MIRQFVMTFSLLLGGSAFSQTCMDDFDLRERPQIVDRVHQDYTYEIPYADEPGYWTEIDTDAAGIPRRIAWNRNFYVFGEFLNGPVNYEKEPTIITAGLYRGDEMIYMTVINCEKGTWENWITNKTFKLERIYHGEIDKNLTSCAAGDKFDLILKNDNFYLSNWIFNAQPLQHEVRRFDRQTNKVENGKPVLNKNIVRPLKVNSQYSVYNATEFRVKATGKAVFNRLAFGQCTAWPKNMDLQCQKVRDWIQARSKANAANKDTNSPRGLGTFGNNIPTVTPKCFSSKYFDWIQEVIHGDRTHPLYDEENGVKTGLTNNRRAYCCCTNMKTGRIFNNDPKNNCKLLVDCVDGKLNCEYAFDIAAVKDIQDEMGN